MKIVKFLILNENHFLLLQMASFDKNINLFCLVFPTLELLCFSYNRHNRSLLFLSNMTHRSFNFFFYFSLPLSPSLYIYIHIYGNLRIILETTFRHLSFSSLIMTSSNIEIQGLLAVKFYSFTLEID